MQPLELVFVNICQYYYNNTTVSRLLLKQQLHRHSGCYPDEKNARWGQLTRKYLLRGCIGCLVDVFVSHFAAATWTRTA